MSEKRWLVEYWHRGAWWGTEVHAESRDEAEEKVAAMGRGSVRGEIGMTIRLPRWNWLARFFGARSSVG